MRIMSRSQNDLFNHILYLANGDLALAEDALKHTTDHAKNEQDIEAIYKELLSYLFSSMEKDEYHRQYLMKLLKELNEKSAEEDPLIMKTA